MTGAQNPSIFREGIKGATPASVYENFQQEALVAKLWGRDITINPLAYSLSQVEWSTFATLTWRNNAKSSMYHPMAEQRRRFDFYYLLRGICQRLRLHTKDLVWYAKAEFGEHRRELYVPSGPREVYRGHYHVLFGKSGLRDISDMQLAATIESIWPKFGRVVAEPFDASRKLEGVLYASKNEFDARGVPLPFEENISKSLSKLL